MSLGTARLGEMTAATPPVLRRSEGLCLVLGDCRQAPALAPAYVGKVALAVTSPPYHNAISYENHVEDPTQDYRVRSTLSYSQVYLPLLDAAWEACRTMLCPGGHLAVNVGTVLLDGYHFPLPQDIVTRLAETGEWDYVGKIIWNKVTAGVKRAGSVIQKRMPGYWYPNIMTEHIIVVRKPGPVLPRPAGVPDEWWEPVWDLAPVPPGQVPHPAPFPEDLPHRLIRMLTRPGDAVLDPFNGAGATTKAALDLGRAALGFDLEPTYNDYAIRRAVLPSAVRGRQLRVLPQRASEYTPGRSKGRTRHGSGLAARTRRTPR
jgi:site-specific DNA-methyltransferase (adenine-specific)